jgi:predicted outer membrane protein
MADNVSALAVVPTPDPSVLNDQDKAFLQQAQLSNLTEVAESAVALQNTSNIASRNFAHWMIGDHSGQSAQLSSIAQQLGVSLPSALDPQHQAEVSQLSSLTGCGKSLKRRQCAQFSNIQRGSTSNYISTMHVFVDKYYRPCPFSAAC